MMVVFAVLSVCAIAAAFLKPADWQTRLSEILFNEGMALLVTVIYGIFVHFAMVAIARLQR